MKEFFENGSAGAFIEYTNELVETFVEESRSDSYLRPANFQVVERDVVDLMKYIERVFEEGESKYLREDGGVSYADTSKGIRLAIQSDLAVQTHSSAFCRSDQSRF